VQAFYQGVGVSTGIVDVVAGAGSGRQLEASVKGLSAVKASAYADAVLVQNRGDIVGMDTVQRKRDGAPTLLRLWS
jgi:Zn-dependent alcohol dehydrogenase